MNVVVTGGGTVAPIDAVRSITNLSTGRFSAQLTEAFLERGANVWHVATPNALRPFARDAAFDLTAPDPESEFRRLAALRERYARHRDRLRVIGLPSGTVAEYRQTLRSILLGESIDVVLLAAAVSDYEPVPAAGKLSSDESDLTFVCRSVPKVIQEVRDWAPLSFLVGFKLLAGSSEAELVATARRAGRLNRADLTVANDLDSLRAGRHTVHLVPPCDDAPIETLGPEGPIAPRLVDRLLRLQATDR